MPTSVMDTERGFDLRSQLARNLVALRERHNLTHRNLATRLGTSPASVKAWELDGPPKVETLKALAELYGHTLDELVYHNLTLKHEQGAASTQWELSWLKASTDQERASEIWRRLVEGEAVEAIAAQDGSTVKAVERHVHDLLLSRHITITNVSRDRSLEQRILNEVEDSGRARCVRSVMVASIAQIQWSLVRYVLLGQLAKEVFCRDVTPGASVGICGGFATSRFAHALHRGECPGGIRFLPIATSPVFEQAAVSANGLVAYLNYVHFDLGVTAGELPFIVRPDALTAGPPDEVSRLAHHLLANASDPDFIFMGVGSRETGALARTVPDIQRDYQFRAQIDVEELARDERAVGDILYHLVDSDGQPIPEFREKNQLLVSSIGLESLQNLTRRGKRVTIIASGREKAPVVQAVLNAGYVNSLVIDSDLAHLLLELNQRRRSERAEAERQAGARAEQSR